MYNINDAIYASKILNIPFDKYTIEEFLEGINIEAEHGSINPSTNVTNDDLLTLSKFSEKYKTFLSIYLADLRKHHILYFSFSCPKNDINNIYLKLSLFAISIVLYFSLNTLFMTSSKMSNAYFDFKNSGPVYVKQ